MRCVITMGSLFMLTPLIADVEIRTLQSWNLPHPFQGPKSLTENVFSYLINPTMREYVKTNGLSIQYSKEDDCLVIRGRGENLRLVELSLAQLSRYRHPYSPLFGEAIDSATDGTKISFPKVCTKRGGKNLLRLELEYLSVVPEEWGRPVRYGQKYQTLGSFEFPTDVSVEKDEDAKLIDGELGFSAKLNQQSSIHVLSYRGISKEDLQDKLNLGRDEARVYMDVPYSQLLKRGETTSGQWVLFRAGSKALKVLCPNYQNEKIRSLFSDVSYRQIIQKAADYVYQRGGIGIMDTGLQPVHERNILKFNAWRPLNKEMVGKKGNQLKKEWKAWLTSQQKEPTLELEEFFVVEGNRFLDIETDELPELKVYFADIINDQPYFENLKLYLEENGMLRLHANSRNDFIFYDQFRKILAGEAGLGKHHQGIVFDIPVPYNDHIEHYFSAENNFYGLDEAIAPKVVRHVATMESGDWALNSTKHLGRLLRQECPCLMVGQHPFYTYTRKTGEFRLPKSDGPSDAPTSHRLAGRISQSSVD